MILDRLTLVEQLSFSIYLAHHWVFIVLFRRWCSWLLLRSTSVESRLIKWKKAGGRESGNKRGGRESGNKRCKKSKTKMDIERVRGWARESARLRCFFRMHMIKRGWDLGAFLEFHHCLINLIKINWLNLRFNEVLIRFSLKSKILVLYERKVF